MSITQKIYKLLFNRKILSRNRQEALLTRFQPKNDLERSYAQFYCQKKCLSLFSFVLLNLSSIFILIKYKFSKKSSVSSVIRKSNVVYLVSNLETIPPFLKEDFEYLPECNVIVKNENTEKVAKLLRKKYFLSFYFRAKIITKICNYEYIIQKYCPTNIVTTNEYSFTSSVLSNYCEERNISHIDVMHGEKIFDIFDSFFRFSKIYVWNEFYIELFKKMKADVSNYSIFFPKSIFSIEPKEKKKFDLTVYLQDQNTRKMVKLCEALKKYNGSVSIRPHPRYTNYKKCTKIFSDFNVENPKDYSCEESMQDTKIICSLFSTVLLSAINSNIKYLIDDISDKKMYKKLFELDYYPIQNGETLSSFIGNEVER